MRVLSLHHLIYLATATSPSLIEKTSEAEAETLNAETQTDQPTAPKTEAQASERRTVGPKSNKAQASERRTVGPKSNKAQASERRTVGPKSNKAQASERRTVGPKSNKAQASERGTVGR
ncbi:hypothetical protein BgiBS90_021191 [Biomphalaria glabrata]|nr:hypothetical protein BgiBS90_021191 [Biomphalaria glabrata]